MGSASNSQVLSATRQWLKPLIHVLIRCGVTWKDFAALAKTTYVEVATRQFGKRGRPTNVSRTAVLTGLARREVRKQRERLATAPEGWTPYVSKASLVLAAWHTIPSSWGSMASPCYCRSRVTERASQRWCAVRGERCASVHTAEGAA